MKKIYNKNAREKQLLEEAYGAIYERRNPDSGEWGGGLKGVFPGAEEGPEFDEEEESAYNVGDWVWDDDGTHASIVSIDGDEVALYDGKEGWTVNISDISREQRDNKIYYPNPFIKREPGERVYDPTKDEEEEDNVNWDEKDEVDEVGGGMNAKEFNTINKNTPL